LFIFCISFTPSHFLPEKTKKILGRFKGTETNIASTPLETLTPFYNCSSIPIFSGAPIAIAHVTADLALAVAGGTW